MAHDPEEHGGGVIPLAQDPAEATPGGTRCQHRRKQDRDKDEGRQPEPGERRERVTKNCHDGGL